MSLYGDVRNGAIAPQTLAWERQMHFARNYKYHAALIMLGLFYYAAPVAKIPPIHMSPDQYLHRFPGRVTVDELRPWPGVLSVAQMSPGLCRISITPISEVGVKVYECLYLVELANCNGAVDVNADARRRVIPAGYERTCESADWSSLYRRLNDAQPGEMITEW